MSFNSLNIDKRLKDNLKDLEFFQMTPVQELSLPSILEGKDVIAQAETGSGKTVAFGLGIINGVAVKNTRPQALILCPTRELAEQVATELRTLSRAIPNIKILTITGGQSEYHQERSLAHGAHIIVGTTGRVRKLLKNFIIELDHLKYYVLDEADRMLDMGFSEDIQAITDFIPKERQTLLFSATYPENIELLSRKIQRKNVEMIKVESRESTQMITEEFYSVPSHQEKLDVLLKVLGKLRPERFIVFCKTKAISDSMAKELKKKSISVASIHGDLEQRERTATLTRFSNKSLSGLIATDVAARGLDIKGLDLVVNLDLPPDPEVYVHRIGRTGRAGAQGNAVSFLCPKEDEYFERICEYQSKNYDLLDSQNLEEQEAFDFRPSMKTLFISGGKRDKLRPGDIVGAIVGEAKVDVKVIGDISVMNLNTYVAIKSEDFDHVLRALNRGKIKNRRFKIGVVL